MFSIISLGPHQSKIRIKYLNVNIATTFLKLIIKSRKNCSNVTIKISVTYKIIILLQY